MSTCVQNDLHAIRDALFKPTCFVIDIDITIFSSVTLDRVDTLIGQSVFLDFWIFLFTLLKFARTGNAEYIVYVFKFESGGANNLYFSEIVS